MSNPSAGDWAEASIQELQLAMSGGQLSSVELVNYYLERIATYDQSGPQLNAIAHLNPSALEQAEALDRERARTGARGLLHGIPVLVKDNYETVEMPTTVGSKLFAGHHPRRDADLVARLKEAGAVVLAKTNMHEFAYGITTVGSSFGATRNPYNLLRNSGGSSGGTGAAVAADFAVLGMGSDTCGSIRIPAAQNNLVGLRATQGLFSSQGIVPLSSTQDIGGPLAKRVTDLAIALDTLQPAGEDAALARSDTPASLFAGLSAQRGARIGVLIDWMRQDNADAEVAAVVAAALEQMTLRAEWQTSELPSPRVNAALDRPWNGHVVLIYEFKQDIERYLAANPGLGYTSLREMVARRLHHPDINDSLQASIAISDERALYEREIAQRSEVRAALESLLEEGSFDALVYPTIRRVAAPLGEPQMGTNCRLSSNSGLPAISVPAGFTTSGMPVGLELLGRAYDEQRLLNLALAVESTLAQRRAPQALYDLQD